LTDGGLSQEKCQKRKEKQKSPQVASTLVPRQKGIGCCAREKAASKSVPRGEVENAVSSSTPHISPSFHLLPRPAWACVYFLKFQNWKRWR